MPLNRCSACGKTFHGSTSKCPSCWEDSILNPEKEAPAVCPRCDMELEDETTGICLHCGYGQDEPDEPEDEYGEMMEEEEYYH
jgi:ribosomal protein L37E